MPMIRTEMKKAAHINMKMFQRLRGFTKLGDYLNWIFENPKEAGEDLCRMEKNKITSAK